jgi:hypothetical protein
MRSALFWDVTRRRVVIVYRRFGTTYRPHLQGSRGRGDSWHLKMGTTRCPETMVNNYNTTPRDIAQERRSYKKVVNVSSEDARFFLFDHKYSWRKDAAQGTSGEWVLFRRFVYTQSVKVWDDESAVVSVILLCAVSILATVPWLSVPSLLCSSRDKVEGKKCLVFVFRSQRIGN